MVSIIRETKQQTLELENKMGARVTKNISREEGCNICGKTF